MRYFLASLLATSAYGFGGHQGSGSTKAEASKEVLAFLDKAQCALDSTCLWEGVEAPREDTAVRARLEEFLASLPVCSEAMCYMACPLGFKQDENGCDICECREPKEPLCPLAMCMMHCETGFAKDERGCDKCECNEADVAVMPACEPVKCRMYCEYGYVKDSNGCDTCECVWPDQARRRTQEAYGGGYGGGYGAWCPYGSSWGGIGPYCLGGDIWWCNNPNSAPSYVVTECSNGCIQQPAGTADYCAAYEKSCIYDYECMSGEICTYNTCSPKQTPPGRSCIYDYDCPTGNYCSYNNCVPIPPVPPSRSCIYDNECRTGEICAMNQCQARPQCWYDSDCWNGYECYNSKCYESQAASPLDAYQVWYDYAIKSNNDRVLDYVPSAEACANACDNEVMFNCKAFEYAPAGQRCVLSKSSSTSGAIYSPGWNLYVKLASAYGR